MYKNFIDYIISCLYITNPELSTETELKAVLCHYLRNPNFNFNFRTNNTIININQCIELAENHFKITTNELIHDLHQIPFLTNEHADFNFNFIDLFAGIGGFRLALQNQGGVCEFSSEWDKAAKETYFNNYGEFPFGDINQYSAQNLPDDIIAELIPTHNILAAGFPCQPFSNAGVSARNSLGLSHGFECKTQGTLFYSVARVAFIKQPEILLLENVKNITSHNNGKTFKTIRDTISDVGYKFSSQIVNSQSLVAQRRERCYMVCVRNDLVNEFGEYNPPDFHGDPIPLRSILEVDPEDTYTISDRLWAGHINRTARNIKRGAGFTAHVANLDRPSNTIVARYGKDGKECLIPQTNANPRYLTKDETRQLFGFPENFILPKARTPTYKQLGNSVVVPVVERIAASILAQYSQSF